MKKLILLFLLVSLCSFSALGIKGHVYADVTCSDGTTAATTVDCPTAGNGFDPLEDACSASTDDPETPEVESSIPAPTDSSVCNGKDNDKNPLTGTNGYLIRAVRFITFLTGIASIVIMIYAGLKYITSNGDSSTVSAAKSTILYALIGVVVSLMSQGIILFVINNVK